jgi:ADP-ribose pyrophosphatase YjhB (NUDIX family)
MAEPHQMNYCPVCGQPLTDGFRYGKQRRVCAACGFVHFRDPKVATATFVTRDDHVLLIQRGVEPRKGKWGFPAGFVDYGEDPREAARREVREETGLDVRITGLVDVVGPEGSDDMASIVLMFRAAIVSGTLSAGDDAAEVAFYAPDEIPMGDLAFESTRLLLKHWLSGGDPSE